MLTKRIIPCLDVKDGRTVKGVNFEGLRDAGDPVELGANYARQGGDELVFLDITATQEKRKTLAALVEKVARHVNIPFTVGGGVTSVEDVSVLLKAGADKVAVNSAAVRDPSLIGRLSDEIGRQNVVVAVDAKAIGGDWWVHVSGGKKATNVRLFDWVAEIEERGGGEILFTSMEHDGTKNGFAVEAIDAVAQRINIPLVASGGAGKKEHFGGLFLNSGADAALAASIFHYGEVGVRELKEYLRNQELPIRL